MAMMVSGVILSAVVTLSWALAAYNAEGEAAVELATHGRYAIARIGRDVRASLVTGVTPGGALVLWAADVDDDDTIDVNELVVYYQPEGERTLIRGTCNSAMGLVAANPANFALVKGWVDQGIFDMLKVMGLTSQETPVCGNVDTAAFYVNRPTPETISLEYVLSLSRAENVIESSGRTIALNLYGAATMRSPYAENGFEPQH